MRGYASRYLINIILLLSLLPIVSGCDELNIPETIAPESAERTANTPSAESDSLPSIILFTADPEEVTAEETAIIHWAVSGASAITIEPDIGEVPVLGVMRVAPNADTTYVLTAVNDEGSVTASTSVICSETYAGTETTGEVLEELPETLLLDPEGEESVLRLADEPASIEELESLSPPELMTEPPPSAERTLPLIIYFDAYPDDHIEDGGFVLLHWSAPDASAIFIESPNHRHWERYMDQDMTWSPNRCGWWVWETTTFELWAWNRSIGWQSESLTVHVGQGEHTLLVGTSIEPVTPPSAVPEEAPPTEHLGELDPMSLYPVIHYWYADPETIQQGETSRLRFEVSNANWIEIGYFDGFTIKGYRLDLWGNGPGIRESWGGYIDVQPSSTRRYMLRAWNYYGYRRYRAQYITVTVAPLPTILQPPSVEPVIPKLKGFPSVEPVEPRVESPPLEPLKPGLTPALDTGEVHPINPVIHHFTLIPESIPVGGNAIISWEVSNAERIEVNYPPSGIVVSIDRPWRIGISERWGDAWVIAPSETREYFIRAYGPGEEQWLQENIVLQVDPSAPVPDGPPTIVYFRADPDSIEVGDSSRLRWEVSDANFVSISKSPSPERVYFPPSSGHYDVSPDSTSVYSLIAVNGVGTVEQYVTVNVSQIRSLQPVPKVEPVGPPTINFFRAYPESIPAGSSSKLTWEVLNADTVVITAVSLKTKVSATGGMAVSPSATTKYTLTATNTAGSQNQNVTVIVEGVTPPKLPSPTEKAKPDLVITDIWSAGSTQWYYTIKNQGKVECNGSSSQLIIDDKPHAVQSVGPLAAGESRQMYFSYKYACETGTSHTWAVVADTKNAIDESEEGNNSRIEKFICSK